MATLITIPIEIHHHIASLLYPCDVAALSISCQTLKRHLGRDNQFYWYQWLRDMLPSRRHIPSTSIDNLISEFKDFRTGRDGKDYWSEAISIISGNSERAGCRLCLSLRPHGNHYTFIYFRRVKPGDAGHGNIVKHRYCSTCFRNWHITIEDFERICPEVPLPSAVGILDDGDELVEGDPYLSLQRWIPIPSAIKAIKDFHGVDFETAMAPAHRFKSKWAHSRGDYEANIVHDALVFITERYIQKYPHLHVAISPRRYYKSFSESLLLHVCLNTFGRTKEVFTGFPNLNVIYDVMKISRLLEKGQEGRAEALELVDAFHVRIFSDPDNFDPGEVVYPNGALLWEGMSSFAPMQYTRYSDPPVLAWHAIYTYLYFYDGPQFKTKIRCYWCLRNNGWKDTADNRYIEKPDVDIDWSPVTDKWIMAHIVMHHPDFIWKRPKSRVHKDCWYFEGKVSTAFTDPSGKVEFIVNENEIAALRKERPDFENEELEDVPFPEDEHDYLAESDYFHWV